MGEIRSYRDLIAWQKSMELCVAVHRRTARFPKEEIYGLAQHARRSAVSVSSNIAEGWGRGAPTEFLRFLRIARGSLCELETQVQLAECLGYLHAGEVAELNASSGECSKVLQGLIESIERKQAANERV
ncbi:MAG: four helix bundle protein [Phycisphaerae bacterium]|nr:four helix bundle protein [Phycisphaerae bacterium]